MISVLINTAKFEYDIHSLVKAFFPKEDVKVVTEDSDPSLEEGTVYRVHYGETEFSFYEGDTLLGTEPVKPDADRIDEKNAVKRLVYRALSARTGRTLVWGDLTGIRPTKIPRKMLDEGKSEAEILSYMKDTYLVGDEKSALALDIAKREREILKPLRDKGYSIYIGIPFCPTTCLYCSFTSNPIAMWRDRVSEYLNALKKEIDFTAHARAGQIIDTVYIGGGTPTTLSAEELDELLSYMEERLDLRNLLEFTVEAGRADSITVDKLAVLHRHRVTRISVNPQTMNQKTLDLIGRRHTVEDVVRAFNDARTVGFDNINMDIILGLPGEDTAEVTHTIDEIVKLRPDSLTVHSLAIKRGSRLYEWILNQGYATMVNTDATMAIAAEGAERLDMKPYYLYRQKNMAGNFENTGYAREGAYGIYNILIMEELEPIVAMGPGSVSKVITREGRLVRSDNVKDVAEYIARIDEMLDRKKELFSLE